MSLNTAIGGKIMNVNNFCTVDNIPWPSRNLRHLLKRFGVFSLLYLQQAAYWDGGT